MNTAINAVSQEGQHPSSQTIIKTTTLALLLSAAPFALGAAHAQDGSAGGTPAAETEIDTEYAQDGSTWLDTITVIGTRTEVSVQDNPASVTVLDQQQLERKMPESIAEMLRDVPGVEVVDSSAAGMQRIRIRGESSRRVTILVDGQEITDHSTYGTPLLVDPTNVERIDVVRGPASVLYGAKAIGGVINIITKGGAPKPVEVEVGGAYYSGTDGWQGWAAAAGTLGDFDYRFSGEIDDHKDRRVPKGQYTATGRLDGTAFSNDDLYLHLGYAFGEARNHYVALKAEQHRLETESWTDPSYLTYPIVGFNIDLPLRDRRKVGLFYDGTDLSPVVRKVHLDAYYQTIDRLFENEVVMNPLPPITVGVTSTSDDTIVNYGGTAQVDLQFHPDHFTIVGLHYLADNLETEKTSTTTTQIFPLPPMKSVTWSLDDATIDTVSAFAQDEWAITEDFKLTAGLRYYYTETSLDYTSDITRAGYGSGSDDRFVTAAGLVYTGIPDTTLRVAYSEGYIMPTLLQLFTDSTAGRGAITYGNPDLDPETSQNVEIGARHNAGGLVLDAAAFYAWAEDYITSVPCATSGRCPAGWVAADYIYVNADAATTYGFELAAEYTLPGIALTPYVTGAWIRRELEFPTYSTYHSDTPALSGRAGLRWEGELAGGDVWADLFVRAASGVKLASMGLTGLTVDSLPSWGTLNFAFGGTFGADDRLLFSVHFNNILDKEYRPTFDELPGTGRNVQLMARLRF